MDLNGKGSTLRHKQNSEVLPASQYLQDRLQERRARNTRPKRTRQSDIGPRMTAGQDDDLFFAEGEESRSALARSYDSSPLAPASRYGSDNVSIANGSGTLSAGGRKRRTPGARELDEQMDRLTKQNFDLKLELDHRRESQAKMHAEIASMRATVERAQRLEEEHEELMRINSLLVEELEKRDRAIQEAAEIICELEEKVEDYEESRATETRPSTAHADSGYAGTETQEQMPPSSPPVVVISRGPSQQNQRVQTPGRPRREPAFLTSEKPSTTALRAVYLDAGRDLHPVQSFNSILSKRTSTIDENALAEEVLNSPRLSALSESSFPSIYGKKCDTPEKFDWEDLPESNMPFGSAHSRQDSISRVNQWIEERQSMNETPSKSNRISSPVPTESTMATHTLLRKSAENSKQTLSSAAASARSDLLETPAATKPFPVLGGGTNRSAPRTPAATSEAMFGEPLLPPTPESASTRMLRPSRSSFVGERNQPHTTPAQVKSSASLQPRPGTATKQAQLFGEPRSTHKSDANLCDDVHGFVQTAQRAASDEVDSETDDEDYDAQSNTLQDLGLTYDGYPDGNSITNGTPSRFLMHNKQPSAATDMFFKSVDLSPLSTFSPGVLAAQRRKSSAEVASSSPPSKPSMFRAETSPNVYGPTSMNRRGSSSHSGRPTTGYSTESPRSYYSASSSIHPTNQRRRDSRSLSPSPYQRLPAPTPTTTATIMTPSPPKSQSRPQPSPAPTSASKTSFTQRTQSLLRRLSATNSPTTTEETSTPPSHSTNQRREREISSLPTLTSTHSSAYNQRPQRDRETRRPSSSREVARPGMSPRTMTEPADVAEATAASKRGLFRRRGSFMQTADVSSVKSVRSLRR